MTTASLRPRFDPKILTAAILGLAGLAVFFVMQPHLLLSATTPSGGDMGAHVLVPAFVRDTLLPEGRLIGWSNDWYAGFPVLYFYFPLPAFAIVALDVLLPYGVAFKLVTVAGLVAMPFAAFVLGRGIGLGRAPATIVGAAGAAFVFMESYSIYGGNIKSTLAGEYSYSWSLAFSLIYLGIVLRDTREGRGFSVKAALALAAMALSHVLTTLIVGSLSVLLLLRGRRSLGLFGTWALGFALAAFWVLPLLATIGFTTDMNWVPLRGLDELFPTELWPMMLLGAIGAAVALWRRLDVGLVLIITLVPLLLFPYLDGKLWNGRVLPYWYFGAFFFAGVAVALAATALWRRLPDRRASLVAVTSGGSALVLLPAFIGLRDAPAWARWNYSGYEGVVRGSASWGLALLVLVAAVAGAFLWWVWRTYPRMRAGASLVAALAVVLAVIPMLGANNPKPFDEYGGLMETVAALGEGRVMWEANSEMDRYGTPMALMLFPYWTQSHTSMEGLLFESSLSTPFHFLNASEVSQAPSNPIPGLAYAGFDLDRALSHLQKFNVRYYVTFTEESAVAARAHPAYTEVAASSPWVIFELPPSDLIEVAEFQPAVYATDYAAGPVDRARSIFFDPVSCFGDECSAAPDLFNDAALEWYGDITLLDHWLVEDGPADWPRVSAGLEGLAEMPPVVGGTVTDVVLEDHRIAFRTTAVGQPHLIKVSYFPNWTATGADGPWRAAPAFMVVVPTTENVELTFDQRVPERAGMLLSGAGLGALVFVVWLGRRRRTS